MKIVIVGAGDVGFSLADTLSQAGHNVILIEQSAEVATQADEELNLRVITGSGSSAKTLDQAKLIDCDYFLSMTRDDRTNLVSCSVAQALGAKHTIARIHDQTYQDTSLVNYQLHFGIDYLLNPEALCAVDLAKTIRNPGRVAVQNFARGSIEVQAVTLSHGSQHVGKELKNISLAGHVRVGLVQRGAEVLIATAETVLQAGDVLTLFGAPDDLAQEKNRCQGKSSSDHVRVVLYGGDETSISLIRLLKNPKFKVRIIEKNRRACEDLAEAFPEATIICGDGTSRRLLEEEQIGSADHFIGASKDDEDNIMTCLLAKQLGAKNVHLVVNKPDYEEVLANLKDSLGVDTLSSPRIATMDEILRYISTKRFVELSSLSNGKVKIVEVRVHADSQIANKKVKDLPLKGSPIVALMHKFHAVVPSADDTVLPGDRLVLIIPQENEKKIFDSLV